MTQSHTTSSTASATDADQDGLDLPEFLKREQPSEDHKSSWRDTIKIHPACELIPPASDAELDALGEDILANGLSVPIAITSDGQLLDGRSRLDALEKKGVKVSIDIGGSSIAFEGHGIDKQAFERVHGTIGVMIVKTDPVTYVISANLHRRHLTAEQKRDLIAKLLKAEHREVRPASRQGRQSRSQDGRIRPRF